MKPFDALSVRQRKILRYIDQFSAENGYPPTIREIGDATKTKSTSVVNYNLNKLVQEGYIDREKRVSRGVRIIVKLPNSGNAPFKGKKAVKPSHNPLRVPYIGVIAAGEPIPIPDDVGHAYDEDDMIEVTSSMLNGLDPSEVFALRVKGDSMVDAMIHEGDIVLFRKQSIANNGDMVAAWLEDRNETTLKYFFHEGEKIRLQPAHPHMQPIYVDAAHCQIHGKVLSVLRQLR